MRKAALAIAIGVRVLRRASSQISLVFALGLMTVAFGSHALAGAGLNTDIALDAPRPALPDLIPAVGGAGSFQHKAYRVAVKNNRSVSAKSKSKKTLPKLRSGGSASTKGPKLGSKPKANRKGPRVKATAGSKRGQRNLAVKFLLKRVADGRKRSKKRILKLLAAQHMSLRDAAIKAKGGPLHKGLERIGLAWRAGRENNPQLMPEGVGIGAGEALAFREPLDFLRFSFKEGFFRAKKGGVVTGKQMFIDAPDANNNDKAYDGIISSFDGGQDRAAARAILAVLDAKIGSVGYGTGPNKGTTEISVENSKDVRDAVAWVNRGDAATRTRRQQAVSLFVGITQMAEGDASRNLGIAKNVRGALARIADGGATFRDTFNNRDGTALVSWSTRKRAPIGGTPAYRAFYEYVETGNLSERSITQHRIRSHLEDVDYNSDSSIED